MNAPESRQSWSRLVSAARQAHDARDEAAPFGFSTRVAALAMSAKRAPLFAIDRLALRALGIACLLAVGSVVINYTQLRAPAQAQVVDDQQPASEDAMSVLLDV